MTKPVRLLNMVSTYADTVICFIIVGSTAVLYVLTQIIRFSFNNPLLVPDESYPAHNNFFHDSWLFRLILNLLGYATIFVPGYLIFQYVKKTKYLEKGGTSCLANLIRQCFASSDLEKPPESSSGGHSQRTLYQEALVLFFCLMGLLCTYLTWGVLQEKIITKAYTNAKGDKMYFKDSQFLVFVNRILAFILSGAYLAVTRQERHSAPLYKYVYCSFSNILSSWCQYEALKYVSFPTQVLAKASKIIPVMVMGKLVSRTKYEYYEYVTALLISMGMALFLWGAGPGGQVDKVSTLSGLFLLASYMIADSFTSNWQGAIFKQHRVSSVQMMCGVNLFSCFFLAVSLLQQGGFANSLGFMMQFYQFTFDCVVLSICSAAGQLFIFYTIFTFGPVVFVIIMTIRQGMSILLSCLIYGHKVTVVGGLGVLIVFIAVFLRMYCNQRLKTMTRRRVPAPDPCKV